MARFAPSLGRTALFAIMFGLFLMQLDMSIVNVAIPDMRGSLHAGGQIAWIVDAYTIPIAALLLSAGTLGDRIGHGRVYRTGMVIFLIGSVCCALSPSLGALVASRVLQGLGASALAPASLALLVRAVPEPAAQQRAVGLWGSVGGLGLVAGPLIGGLLTSAFGWRAVFAVTALAAAIAFAASLRIAGSTERDKRTIDSAGLVLAAVTLTALVTFMIEGPEAGWLHSVPVLGLVVAALAAMAFVMVERQQAAPMLPVVLVRHARFSLINLATMLMTFGNFGFLLIYSIYLQQDRGLSAGAAGLHLLPITIGMVVGGASAYQLVERIGPAPTAAVAFGGEALMLGAFLLAGPEGAPLVVLAVLFLMGVGTGTQQAPMVGLGVRALPAGDAGLASGIANTSRQVGAAVGSGLLGSLFATGWGSFAATCGIAIAGWVVATVLCVAIAGRERAAGSDPEAARLPAAPPSGQR